MATECDTEKQTNKQRPRKQTITHAMSIHRCNLCQYNTMNFKILLETTFIPANTGNAQKYRKVESILAFQNKLKQFILELERTHSNFPLLTMRFLYALGRK